MVDTRWESNAGFGSHDQLPTIKGLGVTARGVAFHATQSHESKEGLRIEPVFTSLRLKGFHQKSDFRLADFLAKRYEDVWLTKVAIVLRDFILQDQMVAERVPG